jgi:hypothetical protein
MFASLRNGVSDQGYDTQIGHAGQLTLQVRLIRSNTPHQPGTISIEVIEKSNLFSILKITNLRLQGAV